MEPTQTWGGTCKLQQRHTPGGGFKASFEAAVLHHVTLSHTQQYNKTIHSEGMAPPHTSVRSGVMSDRDHNCVSLHIV